MTRPPCPLKSGTKKLICWWIVVFPGLEKRVLHKQPWSWDIRPRGPSIERWLAVFIFLGKDMSHRDLPENLFSGCQTYQSSVSHWETDWGYLKKKKKSGDLVLVCDRTKPAMWLWASFSEFFIWKCPHWAQRLSNCFWRLPWHEFKMSFPILLALVFLKCKMYFVVVV